MILVRDTPERTFYSIWIDTNRLKKEVVERWHEEGIIEYYRLSDDHNDHWYMRASDRKNIDTIIMTAKFCGGPSKEVKSRKKTHTIYYCE